jgi:hypothetical protein
MRSHERPGFLAAWHQLIGARGVPPFPRRHGGKPRVPWEIFGRVAAAGVAHDGLPAALRGGADGGWCRPIGWLAATVCADAEPRGIVRLIGTNSVLTEAWPFMSRVWPPTWGTK